MKVIWVANVKVNPGSNILGGWLESQYMHLKERGIQVLLMHPSSLKERKEFGAFSSVKDNDYSIQRAMGYFVEVIKDFSPDLIHIHGTELPHALAVARAARKCGVPYIVSLQGIVGEIYRHVCTGLEPNIIFKKTFRDIFFGGGVNGLRKLYKKRSFYEVEVVEGALCILGRTEWDRAWVDLNFKNKNYHVSLEPLRKQFLFADNWNYEKCKKRRIFIAQGANPIKGLHVFLEALKLLKKRYEDIEVVISGDDFSGNDFFSKIKRTSYQRYILQTIKNEFADCVSFVGYLSASQMIENFLQSNVYVQSSLIENSPNSLMEAVYLGVPAVASYVGGVPSIYSNEKVLFYQADSPLMLAKKIDDAFKMTEFIDSVELDINTESVGNGLIEVYDEVIRLQGF